MWYKREKEAVLCFLRLGVKNTRLGESGAILGTGQRPRQAWARLLAFLEQVDSLPVSCRVPAEQAGVSAEHPCVWREGKLEGWEGASLWAGQGVGALPSACSVYSVFTIQNL